MDTFKSIVLRGNIRNDDDKNDPNTAACELELIPNNLSENRDPVSFLLSLLQTTIL